MVSTDVHTNLFSKSAENMFNSFILFIRDHGEARWRRHLYGIKVEVAPNGEILFKDEQHSYKSVFGKKKTPAEVLDHIAWMMKIQVQNMLKRKYADVLAKQRWNRMNNEDIAKCCSSASESFTVSDVYLIYEIFMNRKNATTRYPKAQVAKLIGVQKDPIQTEMEMARREEIKNIEAKYAKLFDDCAISSTFMQTSYYTDDSLSEANREMRKIYLEIKAKWAAKLEELKKQKAEELANLNSALDFMAA